MKDVVELINRLYNVPDRTRYDISVSIWIAIAAQLFLAPLRIYNPSLLGISIAKQLYLNKNNM